MTEQNILILFSGGLDSTSCINYYMQKDCKVNLLFINYDQESYKNEKKAVEAIANYYELEYRKVSISDIQWNKKNKNELIGRNLTLISLAINSFPFNSGTIALGIHGNSYVDCGTEFYDKAKELTYLLSSGCITLEFPFIDYTKFKISQYAKRNNIPTELTYSCEKDDFCGNCTSCLEKKYITTITENMNDLIKQRNLEAKFSGSYFPLLFYSFSSKGFPEFNNDINNIPNEVPLLFSLYDLYYCSGLEEKIYNLDERLIYWDSGGYETKKNETTDNVLHSYYKPKKWTVEEYRKSLKKLSKYNHQKIIVSFEDLLTTSYKEYLQSTFQIFDELNFEFTACILLPRQTNDFKLEITSTVNQIQTNNKNYIIGVTQKDLGINIRDQIISIWKIRKNLNTSSMYIPLHIFGCLTPKEIIMYYLCGADIFDGLSWQRYFFDHLNTYYKDEFLYDNNSVFFTSKFDLEKNLKMSNISYMERLREQVYSTCVFDDFNFDTEISNLIEFMLNHLNIK